MMLPIPNIRAAQALPAACLEVGKIPQQVVHGQLLELGVVYQVGHMRIRIDNVRAGPALIEEVDTIYVTGQQAR